VVTDMVFVHEFDKALTALDAAHARVMLMVQKQQMQHPDGYFYMKVDLIGMARKCSV